eukprot:CAMPEP_0194166566 /NCGR_PEP_ID=MMETSP0154-20130528/2137_1 /TAXON_ID=1049557 /ORGANISM="Thalassiothrix antarctica, Strain L6-D1" /LENGTH=102 /DNA_ID=CAMNT_0038877269 /DNA_START=372 /DNA_END=680 /DNA_ORIENTATION=+
MQGGKEKTALEKPSFLQMKIDQDQKQIPATTVNDYVPPKKKEEPSPNKNIDNIFDSFQQQKEEEKKKKIEAKTITTDAKKEEENLWALTRMNIGIFKFLSFW